MKDEERINVRIDRNTKAKWIEITQMQAINGSELIRRFIQKYIEEHKELLADQGKEGNPEENSKTNKVKVYYRRT